MSKENYEKAVNCLQLARGVVSEFLMSKKGSIEPACENVLRELIDDCDAVTKTYMDEYVIECLFSAVAYCKQQYHDSGIDWLPSITKVGLTPNDESQKYELMIDFLCHLKKDD
jgi:hypothetical protein